jgi:hypothetical protein
VSRRHCFKTAQQHQEFARAFVAGTPLTKALVLAGYSPKQAKKGMVIVNRSNGLRQAIAAQGKLLADLGSTITVQQRANLVRGRLVLNTIRGTDKGTPSAKALGSDKRVSMWQPEIQSGIVVLSAPAVLQDPEVRKRMLGSIQEEDQKK